MAQRMFTALALGVATAVALVGSAQAGEPVGHPPALGSSPAVRAVAAPDWFERAAARGSSAQAVRPDDRAGVHGAAIGAPAVVVADRPVRPDEGAGVRAAVPVPTSLTHAASGGSHGLDWSNASILLGFTLALVVLASASTLAVRHRRHLTLP